MLFSVECQRICGTVVNKFFPCILLGVIFYTYHTHTDYFLNGLIIKTFNAVLV